MSKQCQLVLAMLAAMSGWAGCDQQDSPVPAATAIDSAMPTQGSEPVSEIACALDDMDCIFTRICARVLSLKNEFPRLSEMSSEICESYPRGTHGRDTCYSIKYARGTYRVPNPNYDPTRFVKQSKFRTEFDPETGVWFYVMFQNGACPEPAMSMRSLRIGPFVVRVNFDGTDQRIGEAIFRILDDERIKHEEAECEGLLEY